MAISRVFGRLVAGVVCKRHPGKKRYVVKDGLLPIMGEDRMRRELPWEKTYEYQKKEGS